MILTLIHGDCGNPMYALPCHVYPKFGRITKFQNFEYLTSIHVMLPWMFAYDSLHYSRYLSLYWLEMNNLDEEKAFYMRSGLFSASMSGRPFSALPHDQWIEMTMNKGSKMKV